MPTGTHALRRAVAAAAAIAVALALALAGCGGSDSDDSQDLNSPEAAVQRNIEKAEADAKAAPNDPEPLADLAKARFQMAGVKNGSTGEYDDDAKAELKLATQAWERYLALNPDPVDTAVAQLMTAAYGPGSLDEPKKAVEIQEVLAKNTRPPSAAPYVQLAQMAYYAGDERTAERASKRALELSPKSRRDEVREALAAARNQQP